MRYRELTESQVPSFVERITDDLLDEILSTGKWVHHGCDIQDQWDGGSFDGYIDPAMAELPFDQVRNTPQFRQALHDILLMMAEAQYENLTRGSKFDNLEPFGPTSLIYRGITGYLAADGTVGVYWSQLKDQSLHRFIDKNKGGFLLIAEAKDVVIDWEETIRSRLDYGNGGDEHEIQLKKGTPVKARCYRVDFPNGRPRISNTGSGGPWIHKRA